MCGSLFKPKQTPVKQTQTSQVQITPEQRQLLDTVMPQVQQFASTPMQTYGGSTVADLTPDERAAQDRVRSSLGLTDQLAGQAAGTNSFLMNPALLDPSSNPHLQATGNAVASDMSRQLTENILPSIRGSGRVGGGVFSGGDSRRALAEGLAVDRTTQNIGDTLSSLYSNAYQSGLSTLSGAVAQNPQVLSQQLFGANALGAVGAQDRAVEQAKLDEAASNHYLSQYFPFLQAQDVLGFLNGIPGAQAKTTMTGTMPSPSTGSQVAGGLLSLASFL